MNLSKSPFKNVGIHSGLTTYNPATHPVKVSSQDAGVAIPRRQPAPVKSAVKIDAAALAEVLAWSAQIKADLTA